MDKGPFVCPLILQAMCCATKSIIRSQSGFTTPTGTFEDRNDLQNLSHRLPSPSRYEN
jgi:hypothetical protein